jgi:predicted transcriptional regulator
VFADAERLARELKMSRSRLYAHAVAEYVARHSSEHVTESLDALFAQDASAGDAFVAEAARRTLRDAES